MSQSSSSPTSVSYTLYAEMDMDKYFRAQQAKLHLASSRRDTAEAVERASVRLERAIQAGASESILKTLLEHHHNLEVLKANHQFQLDKERLALQSRRLTLQEDEQRMTTTLRRSR